MLTPIPALTKQAINHATNGDWLQAIEYNLQILQHLPEDVSALNRLGRAYIAQGQLENAINTFTQVLDIDKYNLIAQKNLDKLHKLKDASSLVDWSAKIDPCQFLKEPGTAKIVSLTRIPATDICLTLVSGEAVQLRAQSRFVVVQDSKSRTIGKIPEDVSYRLVQLINNGYLYSAYIKCANSNQIQILIRETSRPTHLKEFPSFPQL